MQHEKRACGIPCPPSREIASCRLGVVDRDEIMALVSRGLSAKAIHEELLIDYDDIYACVRSLTEVERGLHVRARVEIAKAKIALGMHPGMASKMYKLNRGYCYKIAARYKQRGHG